MLLLLTLLIFVPLRAENSEKIDYYEKLLVEAVKNASTYKPPKDAYEYFANSTAENYGHFDFVVIGLGSAGSVVVNRLSEVGKFNILGLEAGGKRYDVTDFAIIWQQLASGPLSWGYTSVPQKTSCLGFPNKSCPYPRGKGLGGSSLINGVMYVRGHKTDFDEWAKITGSDRWSYQNVLQYFKKSENFFHNNPKAPWNPSYHGKGGNLQVEYKVPNHPTVDLFIDANTELGYKIVDYNANKVGASPTQQNIKSGKRWDTGKAFVFPAMDRPNLKILTESFVTKIRIDKNKRAIGVEFTNGGKNYFVTVSKEVILSAGSISSPQILMNSGIGPRKHLEDKKIQVIEDLAVGENLQDTTALFGLSLIHNYTNPKTSLRDDIKNFLKGVGPLATSNGQVFGFYESSYTKGTEVPEIEIIFGSPTALVDRNTSQPIFVFLITLHSQSVGSIKLKSSDPYEYPLIDSNLLSDPENRDIKTFLDGMKVLLKIINSKALKSIDAKLQGLPEACKQHKYLSKNYMICWLRQSVTSFAHMVGTCSMGRDPKKGAVVDWELKVFGIDGLRVVDASVIPKALAGHTNAAAIMVGEQGADFIKCAHV